MTKLSFGRFREERNLPKNKYVFHTSYRIDSTFFLCYYLSIIVEECRKEAEYEKEMVYES